MPVAASTVSARVAPDRDSDAAGGAEDARAPTLSVSICRTSRSRSAPMAARSASSRRRPVPRASRRFATFAHATSSTTITAPASRSTTGRDSPTIASSSGVDLNALIGVVSRDIAVRGAPRCASSSARACSNVAPSFSRADTANEVTAAIWLGRVRTKRREDVGGALGIDLEMTEVAAAKRRSPSPAAR